MYLSKYIAIKPIRKSPDSKDNRNKICKKGRTLYVLGEVGCGGGGGGSDGCDSGSDGSDGCDPGSREYFVFSEDTWVFRRAWRDLSSLVIPAGRTVVDMAVVRTGLVKNKWEAPRRSRRKTTNIGAVQVQFTNDPMSAVWLTPYGLHHMAGLIASLHPSSSSSSSSSHSHSHSSSSSSSSSCCCCCVNEQHVSMNTSTPTDISAFISMNASAGAGTSGSGSKSGSESGSGSGSSAASSPSTATATVAKKKKEEEEEEEKKKKKKESVPVWVALRECERPIPSVEYLTSDCGVCGGYSSNNSSSNNKPAKVESPVFQFKTVTSIEPSGGSVECKEEEEDEECVRESPQCPMLMRDPPPPPQYHQLHTYATAAASAVASASASVGACGVSGVYSGGGGCGCDGDDDVGSLGVFEAVEDALCLEEAVGMPLFVGDLEDWTFPYV